ncbi:SUKH-4 family immunity protein [Lysinibacillus sp. NPDC093692]|uniref:SUKH-4 family immunity protein n=1 Tax=Lysinibacillus sp. NPDC093692 TaxID=3390578 RepID=UPI003CFC7A80
MDQIGISQTTINFLVENIEDDFEKFRRKYKFLSIAKGFLRSYTSLKEAELKAEASKLEQFGEEEPLKKLEGDWYYADIINKLPMYLMFEDFYLIKKHANHEYFVLSKVSDEILLIDYSNFENIERIYVNSSIETFCHSLAAYKRCVNKIVKYYNNFRDKDEMKFSDEILAIPHQLRTTLRKIDPSILPSHYWEKKCDEWEKKLVMLESSHRKGLGLSGW